ncbi:type II toxin-antitoxin system Phd/YefM family antitoxin [Marivita sp. S6314]|uniref:type II toxin-antitoxin system Phd/YefM family antitoxin n=1 Tax=Marivita sp. S6314 TaxID=2926406 RepID=UPI001FF37AFE|nr:type II toxin-antitoxin system Phd/YefM family antitoxin [Marivita sp. S6314]MCK0149998.1 type II toxin-antitoxin system Phd/YefM family antitoxin [Marivita sp. S6314]
MFIYNSSPLEDISTETLRSNLRRVLDDVNFHDTRYAILRRGRPVAGLVPITEARALFEATRRDRRYRDVHLQQQARDQERLRRAISGRDPFGDDDAPKGPDLSGY